jgi:DNA-binding NtrC family response regulator
MERTLLLVDDEDNIVRSLMRLLHGEGYNILTADSGQQGLELLRENEVGVIISDQRMPEMSGVQFLGKVKDLFPDTVRIMLSGYTDLNSVTDAINEGAIFKFLTKPWDDELLRRNISEAFRHFELSHENQRLKQELQRSNEELRKANEALEKHLKQQGHTVDIQHRSLQISQEILENLPVGVIGVSGDGMIAIANRKAVELLTGNSAGLVGCFANELLPSSVQNEILELNHHPARLDVNLTNGTQCEFLISQLGKESTADGIILTISDR